MSCYYVIGVRKTTSQCILKLQEVLTENGCKIKARLGLHEVSEEVCANDGLIILQPCGELKDVEQLVKDLNQLEGLKAKTYDLK
jgi:hypothetical protein